MDASVYTRPNKPKTTPVSRRQAPAVPEFSDSAAPLAVHADTQCHVTPPDVAARMVGYLEASCDMLTLEPSAGTGNLLQALIDSGHSRGEVVAIEREASLYKALRQRFNYEVTGFNDDFLAYADHTPLGVYPRVIMNPPFNKVRQHITAAWDLLGPSGHSDAVLVALVPVTYEHPQALTLETLGPDTFANAKVNTKIIRMEK